MQPGAHSGRSPVGEPVHEPTREHFGLRVVGVQAEVTLEFGAEEQRDLRCILAARQSCQEGRVETGVLIVRPTQLRSHADWVPLVQHALEAAHIVGSSQLIQDALDGWAMDAVVRLKVHRLRSSRQASPHVAWGALGVSYINQRIEGEAEFVVIEEFLIETEFMVIRVGELAASRCELLPHNGPGLRTLLRHGPIFYERSQSDLRIR